MTDLNSSFQKLISSSYDRINGRLIEKVIGGWTFRGKIYTDRAELERVLGEDVKALGNSIKQNGKDAKASDCPLFKESTIISIKEP